MLLLDCSYIGHEIETGDSSKLSALNPNIYDNIIFNSFMNEKPATMAVHTNHAFYFHGICFVIRHVSIHDVFRIKFVDVLCVASCYLQLSFRNCFYSIHM